MSGWLSTMSGRVEGSPRVAPLLAALAAALAHLGALRNQHALDDGAILAHPAIQSVSALPTALASPWWHDTGRLYRPLTLLALGAERAIAGADPIIPHAVNVALHALIAALVVRLATRWLSMSASLAAGALFALLPVHAEAVSAVVGRAELLSALALLATMLLVTRDAPPTPRVRLAVALSAGAALAAKEGGAAAPLLAFAAAYAYPRQRAYARAWALPAFAATLVMLAARVVVLGALGGDMPHPFFRGMPAVTRIGVALASLPRTAAMLLLPIRPSIEEVPPLGWAERPDALVLGAGAVLLVVSLGLVVRHLRAPSPLTLGACILATTIAPTSNLLFAEGALTARTLYAPSIGAALMLGAAIARAAATRARSMVVAMVAVTCIAGGLASWRETRIWRDTPSVVAAMVARRPDNYRGHEFMAYAARDAGRPAEAIQYFDAAIERFPRDPELLTDAATVALRLKDTTTASRWLTTAVQVSPRAARARTRLHGIMLARGDSVEARRLLAEGLRLDPEQRVWKTILQGDAR